MKGVFVFAVNFQVIDEQQKTWQKRNVALDVVDEAKKQERPYKIPFGFTRFFRTMASVVHKNFDIWVKSFGRQCFRRHPVREKNLEWGKI